MAHDGTDSVRVHGLNNTWPGRTAPNWTGLPSQSADSSLDADWNDPADRRPLIIRWTGWRLRLLVLCALLGCVATAMLVRALIGLPLIYWFLLGVALALYMLAVIVLLSRPSVRNVAYLVMAWCQAGNLVFIAVESTLELGLPDQFLAFDMPVRMAFDMITAAAVVNAVCLHPRRLPGSGWIALFAWVAALGPVVLLSLQRLPYAWWWAQGSVTALGLVAIGLLSWSYHLERHPYATVLRRYGVVTVSTWALLTLALGVSSNLAGMPHNIADVGSMIWYVFLASLLLLVPFLARSQTFMREFSLLAAISTVATSLDLLFVAVFSLGQFASLTLSLFV